MLIRELRGSVMETAAGGAETRSYDSCGTGENALRIVYLTVGGTDISAELGLECESRSFGKCRLHLDAFDGDETVADPLEFRLLKDTVAGADLLIINMHGDPSGYKRYDQLKAFVEENGINTFLMCFMAESMREAASLFTGSAEEYRMLRSYLSIGGEINRASLLRYICSVYGGSGIPADPPVRERMQGLYHPRMDRGIGMDDYLKTLDPDKPAVGVVIGQPSWVNRHTEPHDMLIGCIESLGACTIPVFTSVTPDDISGSDGIRKVFETYFYHNGKRLVDSIVLCGFGFSTLALGNPGDGSGEPAGNFFMDLDVPVLASLALFRPRKEWEKDGIGMEGGELCISVAMPEVDGQLTTVPFIFNEKDESGRPYTSFVPDRIRRIAEMAVRWAKTGRSPVKDRKVSILLNASSMTNSSIGEAGGLDSLESVAVLLKRMKAEGYTIDHVPSGGRELIDELLDNVTDDLESVSDEFIERKAAGFVSLEKYLEWMDRESSSYREWVCRDWGEPAGEIMTLKNRFIVPGVINGNVFIGYEPARGKHEMAGTLIHDPDLSPPHSYLSYYRWISEIFGTDIHIHIGTHGSAEWLPGKGNGLSSSCFPDIVMDDIPNLYLYVIDDPSEGIVAKRRKKSVLVDYLMPSLARSGTYDELGELEGHLQSFLFSKQTMQDAKMKSESEQILALIDELGMRGELELGEDCTADTAGEKAEQILDYVAGLKDGLMTSGLHIAGKVPEGAKLDEMIYCLTRLKNGRIPSLRASVASNMGFDLDHLLDNMSGIDSSGRLNLQIVDEIDGISQSLIEEFRRLGCESGSCRNAVIDKFGNDGSILAVTDYICDTLYPNILGVADEIENMIHGMNGGYIPPGPSGSPSRGNAHLLPTGKNYYSLDPEAVPSRESWKAGCKMADDMISKYIDREGRYPENVGIVVWSIDTMKTGGDDVAYILYLLGVRPVWGSVGAKITGLELIPREELGRPRIDVTVRISSLFRDTFPNLFQLIDEAVEMASEIAESDEDNYLRKHLRADIVEMIEQGIPRDEARERAGIRVFGEPPGTHGAGVDILVESSEWTDVNDLANMYISCGCSAYGRKWRGERMPELFRRRLVDLDVAVKNQVDREIDLIDSDDGYSYLGGINAVVRAAGKRKPVNYLCDTSDPDRIVTRDLEHEIAYMMRTRVLNPKWIESMKQHGFSGATWVHEDVNHILGWDSTSDVIESWMYSSLSEHFLFDDTNREWILRENPYALRDILEDLLEAVERGLWEADQNTIDRLKQIYLDCEETLENFEDKRNNN